MILREIFLYHMMAKEQRHVKVILELAQMITAYSPTVSFFNVFFLNKKLMAHIQFKERTGAIPLKPNLLLDKRQEYKAFGFKVNEYK
jgi:hypothetical protein